MLTSLLPIPLLAISLSVPPNELLFEEILWSSSPNSLVKLFPNTLKTVTPKEIHSYSNGFGAPKYKFTARLFKSTGVTYVLYGGKKSNQLIGLSWQSESPRDCQDIKKELTNTLGRPTELDEALYETSWEEITPNLDLHFRHFSSSCSLLFLPSDPFSYD